MSDSLENTFNNLKKMIDGNSLPNDVQNLVNNLSSTSNNSQQSLNDLLSQVSPEMLNNLSSMLNSNRTENINNTFTPNTNYNNSISSDSSTNSSTAKTSSSEFNLDINTIMKMKSIMDTMNKQNNPNANLLKSLKPYLRDSRKGKLDQYVNLLNITKIADVMKKDQKENKNDT